MSEETVLKRVKLAVEGKKSEAAELSAVAGVLAAHGWVGMPVDTQEFVFGTGSKGRLYVWENTPAGDFALVAGPSVRGEIRTMEELAEAADEAGVVFAPGRAATLTDRYRAGMDRAAKRGSKAAAPLPERAPRARARVAPVPPPRPQPPTLARVPAPAPRVPGDPRRTTSRMVGGDNWMSPAMERDEQDRYAREAREAEERAARAAREAEEAEANSSFTAAEMKMLAELIANAVRNG